VCFVVHKTTLKQERVILITLYLAGAKIHRHEVTFAFFGSNQADEMTQIFR
jgi:hypothetical protein